MKLKKYQKKVLHAYQTFSPSKIDLNIHKSKYFANLEEIFFNKLFLDKEFFKNKSILDLGCGTGESDIFFIKKGARNVTGVDFNKKSIIEANSYKKKLNIKNIEFIHDDILNFLPKKKFDIIVCKGVLPHISQKDRVKLLKKINNYKLKKKSCIILGYLDSSGNLIKLFQQIIVNYIFKNKTNLEKYKIAHKIFKSNFNRFSKYGFRKPIQVFYDYFINERSYGLSVLKIIKNLNTFQHYSSYPFKPNLNNSYPITKIKKDKFNYNYFFLQQLTWFNNFEIRKTSKNLNLFENYEYALNLKNLNLINKKKNLIKKNLDLSIKSINLELTKCLKEFEQFNLLIKYVFNKNINIKNKLNKISKSKIFKKACGIGTNYIVLLKK